MWQYLQNQPEIVRWRMAGLITLVAGIGLVIGWLFWLLPAQLAWVRSTEPTQTETAAGPSPTNEVLTVEQLQSVLGTKDQQP